MKDFFGEAYFSFDKILIGILEKKNFQRGNGLYFASSLQINFLE
jgi:hypothetical protein